MMRSVLRGFILFFALLPLRPCGAPRHDADPAGRLFDLSWSRPSGAPRHGASTRPAAKTPPQNYPPYLAYPDFRAGLKRYWPSEEDVVDITPSPKGNYLIITAAGPDTPTFGRTAPSPTNLYLLSRQGKLRALTHDQAGYESVSWSADEKWVAYCSRGGVMGSIDHDESTPLPHVSWATYVQNVASGKRRRLFHEKPSPLPDGGPILEWIPGRSQLLYASSNPRGFYLLSLSRRKPMLLTPHPPGIIFPRLKKVYWPGRNEQTIVIAPLPTDTSKWALPSTWSSLHAYGEFTFPYEFASGVAETDFSPDGHRLMVLMYGDAEANSLLVAVLEPELRRVRVIGKLDRTYAGFYWSPDGRSLRYTRGRPLEPMGKYEIKVDAYPSEPFQEVNWSRAAKVTPELAR